jgi:hypothetical protein
VQFTRHGSDLLIKSEDIHRALTVAAFLTVCVTFTTALGWFWIRRMPKGQQVEDALEAGKTPREAFALQ